MKALKPKIFLIALLIVANIIPSVTILSPTVQAASRAEEYCTKKKYKGEEKEACKAGFSAGYDRKNDSVCNSRSGDVKDACNDGFRGGKSKRKSEIEADGKKGAESKKSKSNACRSYRNEDERKTCEKAYDSEVVAMAKKAGKEAGDKGESSPCGRVFGGSKAKEACKKSFDAAVKAAKRRADAQGKNTCAGVETFFKFNCSGASTDEGGNKNPIVRLGLAILGWITALVAVAVVGGIVYGGFLYMTAQDNSGQTQKGITVIINSVVALILWIFAYVVINFLVPGGLFS